MSDEAKAIVDQIDHALERVSEPTVVAAVRSQLVEPHIFMRGWDYGEVGQRFACWTVLEDPGSNVAIAWCAEGFGPRCPWGLVRIGELDDLRTSIGQDSGWFSGFMEAWFDHPAATRLPIWHVVHGLVGCALPVSGRLEWDEAWRIAMGLRESRSDDRFYVSHTIAY